MPDLSRRDFLKAAGLGSLGIAAAGAPAAARTFYVGTYTSGKSEGIYRCRLDPASGAVAVEGVTRGVVNPSFLAVDGSGRHLYAVNETEEFEGSPGGGVSAFAIDAKTGELRPINHQLSRGGAPCYLIVDGSGRFVLAANYSGGSVVVLPVRGDGGLGPASDVVQHRGSGPDPKRQEAAHAHSVTLDAANRFAVAADLGMDELRVYRFDAARGTLAPGPHPALHLAPGAGPRHFAFHPDGRRAYVINELDSTVSALAYDPGSGALRVLQTVTTLPAGFRGENTAADLHLSPSGRHLYGSNRGHDSVAVFAIAPGTGTLSPVQHQPTLGKTPRNFGIDPSGRFLLAANQNSDSIVVFSVDPRSGRLSPTGEAAQVPAPVCVRFAPAGG